MKVPTLPISGRSAAVLLAAVLAAGTCQRAGEQLPEGVGADLEGTALTLTEAYRIGDESAGDSLLFGFVYGLAVDSEGQLYITHDRLMRIRKFSKQGVLMGEIGGVGEGPGEFVDLPDVYAGPGDSLYAWDSWASRLTIFSPRVHAYVASFVPSSPEADRFSPREFLGATEHGLLFQYSRGYTPESDESDPYALRTKLVDWSGTVLLDSVAQLSSAEILVRITDLTIGFEYLPFGSGARFAYSADQVLYYGTNEAIRLTARSWSGDRQREFDITVPHVPIPVTQSERQEAIAEAREGFQDMVRVRLPEFKPAYTALVADDEGRLWIELTQRAGEESKTWLIVERSGSVAGRTSVPQNVRLRVVRGGRAYGTMADQETGAPIIVVWDIGS